jgi:glucose dehydrogenase
MIFCIIEKIILKKSLYFPIDNLAFILSTVLVFIKRIAYTCLIGLAIIQTELFK